MHIPNLPQPDLLNHKPDDPDGQQPFPHASILVADDDTFIRHGLQSLLQTQAGWKVIAQANNGPDAIAHARQLQPDILVMDLGMPRMNGLQATRLLLESLPAARVLLLGELVTREIVENALRFGALGYLCKADAEPHLIAAVAGILTGKAYFTTQALQLLRGETPRPRQSHNSDLTSRQVEIIQLLAEGHTNQQMARILGISTRTVDNHRYQIMLTLRLDSFAALVRFAIRNGFVEL